MSYPFRNLVFEGGGIKGIAYVGALRKLESRRILRDIQRVGGTSAGAINAIILALGYSLEETQKILSRLDFNQFLDDSFGVVRDTGRLLDEYGWYKGDFFRSWVGEIIEAKSGNANSTFNDLKKLGYLDAYLVGTNLSTGFSEVFSAEHTPRVCVADAARISMSIPLFFAAVRNFREDVYVDGGVLDNYPIKLFDREKYLAPDAPLSHRRDTEYYERENKNLPTGSSRYLYNRETLGFRLDTREEIAMFRDGAEPPHTVINSFFGYARALIQSVLNAQANQHLHKDDWHRTIYIDTLDVGTVEFDISATKKQALIKQGESGVTQYFKWYNDRNTDEPPLNKPENDEE